MSYVKFTCPCCHAELKAEEKMKGKQVDCPNCARPVNVYPMADSWKEIENVGKMLKTDWTFSHEVYFYNKEFRSQQLRVDKNNCMCLQDLRFQ